MPEPVCPARRNAAKTTAGVLVGVPSKNPQPGPLFPRLLDRLTLATTVRLRGWLTSLRNQSGVGVAGCTPRRVGEEDEGGLLDYTNESSPLRVLAVDDEPLTRWRSPKP